MVRDAGFEPATPSVSRKCSTPELTARPLLEDGWETLLVTVFRQTREREKLALSGGQASAKTPLFTAFHVQVHGLQGDFSRAGETIPKDLAGTGKNPCGKFLEHRLHLHRAILVNPAAG